MLLVVVELQLKVRFRLPGVMSRRNGDTVTFSDILIVRGRVVLRVLFLSLSTARSEVTASGVLLLARLVRFETWKVMTM